MLSRLCLRLALVLSTLAPLSAQPGSFAPLAGSVGCEGINGVPHLDASANNVPRIGRSFGVELTNLPTDSGSLFLVLGFSKVTWLGLPLPIALANVGLWNCTLWQSIDFVLPSAITTPSTVKVYTFPIPNDSSLIGLEFFMQALVDDFKQTFRPVPKSVSNSGRGVIGS